MNLDWSDVHFVRKRSINCCPKSKILSIKNIFWQIHENMGQKRKEFHGIGETSYFIFQKYIPWYKPLAGDDDPATDADVQHTILADTTSAQDFKGTRFIDNLIVDPSGKYSDLDNLCILLENNPAAAVDRKCLLNLGKVEIDVIGDEVLTQNFCDQEGRLVCLVCYKIMGPSEFQVNDPMNKSNARGV